MLTIARKDLLQYLAALALTVAGVILLCAHPAGAQTFTPTRFTVVAEGPANAPAILLLPGLTSGREVFDAEAKILAPKYRLYRVQVNGFAGQPAGPNANGPILDPLVEELHQYLAANKLHPFVIGHSLGGLLGLMLASRHPEDVQKLLVVDALPFYALVYSASATVDAVKPQGEMMRQSLLKQTPEEAAASSQKTAGYLAKDPAGVKLVAANSAASNLTVFANAMYEDLTTDLRPALPAIKTPTTLLYPYDATLMGPDSSKVDAVYQGAYATMPNLTIHRIDDSRHFIQLDQPAAFDAQVQAFLK